MARLTQALLVLAVAAIPAHASFIIDPIFDTSITGNANAAAIENTIDTAISFFESVYTNNITVIIEFQSMTSGLGQSNDITYNEPYSLFLTDLKNTNANPAAIAGLTGNFGNGPNNPATNTGNIEIKSADGRAIGLNTPTACNLTGTSGNLSCSTTDLSHHSGSVDGIVGLNTSITSPPNSLSGNFSLLAVTEHEIDEVLGLGSALADCPGPGCNGVTDNAGNPLPEDLFRYTAPGVLASLNVTCGNVPPAYFSYSGLVNIMNFNTACNGEDWADWLGGALAQVQDAVGTPGVVPIYQNEILALSAIGYTTSVPEPSTSTLLLPALGLLAWAGRRRFQLSAKITSISVSTSTATPFSEVG